jgi:RHS repeat-associated protein
MSMSTVTDHIKKTKTITHYDYDAFGRRTLVQDEGGKIIRTLYDGLSFDIIREQETFADGYFTNTSDTGIAWGAVSEGDGSRYRYIGDDAPAAKEQNGYSVTATNRASSRVALYANGQAVGVTRSSNYASSERSYFGTDLMGTVRSSTTDSGNAEYYEYDVFGKPYGESVSDYAYTGKPYDPTTGMYNYGYRDYIPEVARFSTVDPIRDGSNWFAYCNNEPVNFRDLWGLELTLTVDKDNQSISVYYKHENGAVYMSSGKGSVTTGVVSHDTKPNSDTSRTQDSGGVKTNPTQFPNGEHKITGTKSNPYDDKKYGEIWITTDATQDLPIVDPKTGEKTDKTVNDGGYQIHLTTNSNTNGCIGILDKKVMEMLISFVKLNERLYPSTSKIVVKGGKND